MENLLINTIYPATEGEGVRLGTVQTFVRFQGCEVHCLNCDSKETWAFDEKKSLPLEDVLKRVKTKVVSITGGDPLHPRHRQGLLALIQELKKRETFINIEVTGKEFVPEVFSLVDFISMDLKSPSTKKEGTLAPLLETAKLYASKLQFKSVVQTKEDFDFALKAYKELETKLGKITFPWCLTPAYNIEDEKPVERFDDIFRWNEEQGGIFRVIIQQHKLVYGTKRKDV